MDAEAFLERLDGVQRQSASQFNARCPAHDDDHASLSVSEGRDRLLVHCHAGCGAGAIMEALGLSWRDIFFDMPAPNGGNGTVTIPKPVAPISRRRQEPPANLPTPSMVAFWAAAVKVVAPRLYELKGWTLPTLRALEIGWDSARVTIPVRDAEGRLLTVVRYLPNGKPKMRALKGRGRYLFPAAEAQRVFTSEHPGVWLVEGEPDAISAWELGVPAAAAPGVNKWQDDWAERFKGRRVTVCFDCDDEGRRASRRREKDLRSAGVDVRVVDLAPDRDDGTDLSELLAGATREGRVDDLRAYLARLDTEAWASGPSTTKSPLQSHRNVVDLKTRMKGA